MAPILYKLPEAVPALLDALKASRTLFFDCEGVDLGTKGGSLTVMSFGTPRSPDDAHIVHVPPIGATALRPIFDLLESETIQKVVFDGRMDQCALFYGFDGVKLRNVVDLQIVDVKARRQTEPLGSEEQLERLVPYLTYREVMGDQANMYQHVHKLAGLVQAFVEHGLDAEVWEDAAELDLDKTRYRNWAKKDLSQDQLNYAATEIRLIRRLYAHFNKRELLSCEVCEASEKYGSLWIRDGLRQPSTFDEYRRHPLLPLGIIDGTAGYGFTHTCSGCKRSLTRACFSRSAWDKNGNCLVCRAVHLHTVRKAERLRHQYDSDHDDNYGYGWGYDGGSPGPEDGYAYYGSDLD
uniref:3'-5' exonuclease domain-containing protein n=1 Tax=Mycena chlorophos TaxID=658473 RepID=A0ABQ0L8V1_MYCCL|nr:predicted protein [Mycena chlorophos]